MTQLEQAQKGIISTQMKIVAEQEQLDPEFIRAGIAAGNIIIPANVNHNNFTPFGIGKGLRTKVNANLGTSSDYGTIKTELEKLKAAIGVVCMYDIEKGLQSHRLTGKGVPLENVKVIPHVLLVAKYDCIENDVDWERLKKIIYEGA